MIGIGVVAFALTVFAASFVFMLARSLGRRLGRLHWVSFGLVAIGLGVVVVGGLIIGGLSASEGMGLWVLGRSADITSASVFSGSALIWGGTLILFVHDSIYIWRAIRHRRERQWTSPSV